MRVACLVCNYNYSSYVLESINSVLDQTRPFDEIIVVDDGSTDDSWELLNRAYYNNPQIKLIRKTNGGQMSAFNEGYRHFTGDILFLLDSDDTYHPQYLEKALHYYESSPACDFLISARRMFGAVQKDVLSYGKKDRDLGYSAVLTYGRGAIIGDANSTLSVKRHILEKIMPLPFEQEWRLMADNALTIACSLAGAHKYYSSQPMVNYRVHGANGFFRRHQTSDMQYLYLLSSARLITLLADRLNLDARIFRLAASEFATVPRPSLYSCLHYMRLVARSSLGWGDKMQQIVKIAGSYLKSFLP